MAKSRSTAPGTSTRGGVRSTMDAPFNKGMRTTGSGAGIDGRNKAPFDAPQGMGNGSIPTRFFDTSVSPAPATTANAGQAPLKAPGATQNVGTRRFGR